MKKYKVKKVPLWIYFDYVIDDGFCYVFQETKDDRVHTKKICETTSTICENFDHDEIYIYITI